MTTLCISSVSHAQQAQNPIIWADVPDMAMIRVGDTYYMSSTTMHLSPGLPIMKSKDLVNWEIVNYAYDILDDMDELNLANGKSSYGRGSWASSLRYHNGTYYASTFAQTTGKTYVYTTKDIEKGPWKVSSFRPALHDHSLFFDNDGRVYMITGGGNLRLIELTADAAAIKPDGFNQVIIPNASAVSGPNIGLPAEGSQLLKHDGKYYLFNITWPRGGMRTVIVHRADKITGPYEGRVALQDKGVAQGSLIDTPQGEWFAYLFRDNGAVGRVPYLVPVKWENGWPVLGVDGKVPDTLNLPASKGPLPGIVASDDFERRAGERALPLVWQWNHNPDNKLWSLTARPGYLRLSTGRVDNDFLSARNTLTQRTFGPESSATTAIDVSNLKDGDCAGLALLQKNYGLVGVQAEGGANYLVMVNAGSGRPAEAERISLRQTKVYLKAECDFKNRADKAHFFYSLDGHSWTSIGTQLHMSYTIPHFMGYRFGLFNYATKTPGGFVDFDYFHISDKITAGNDRKDVNNLRKDAAMENNGAKTVNGAVSASSPATTNIPGAEYPRIDADLRVTFRVKAPDAKQVQFELGKRYDAVRDAEGFWTATTDPQVSGFHYYWLVINGVQVNDPASETFYGTGKQTSGIEIPDKDGAFYAPQNVPHGEVRERVYFSKTTGAWRRIFVYTPPDYDTNRAAHYPVLYLQHGGGEDERGWPNQGRVAFIMDNLIAAGQAVPMLVVMEKGYARKPDEPPVPLRPPGGGAAGIPPDFSRMFSTLDEVFAKDLIPFIDATYRTLPDRDHRALAGLSMGGMQSFVIGLGHLDLFSSIGGFSGGGGGFGGGDFDPKTAHNGVMADAEAFNKKVHVLWLGIGTTEPQRMYDSVHNYHLALDKAGIKHVYYESPGTSHEWLTWRRSLHEFAPLLFKAQSPSVAPQGANAEPNSTRPQEGPGRGPGGGTGRGQQPIVLGPDDKPAFPPAPAGYDQLRDDIPHGTVRLVEYNSTTVGTQRHMLVYTPPGFSRRKKYPVLYLLHGIGGDEWEWKNGGAPEVILDNLYTDKKIVPMIVVLPNGRAQKNDRAVGNVYSTAPAFETFEGDLLKDIIPWMETNYPVKSGAKYRALAGLSMGGGQALNFGLGHLDSFAWVGAFSPAPNTRMPEKLLPNPDEARQKLKLLWVACGDKDGLLFIAQRTHRYLAEHQVPHIWHVGPGEHNFVFWKQNLYYFAQDLFK
ncbi:MAG: family 43 glycosylhydrolase [Abitibacteriaceae bacterium]|nr:family 43 glycosylhydrolase [Abditibacteriaceae bacterium]